MSVVKDFYDGHTHIIIRDDNCCSPEEVEAILKRISERATRALLAFERNKVSDPEIKGKDGQDGERSK
ncbi:MAG: hypothetical protein K0S76_1870 [Herbinix sp.]|jgi:S-methylmethionine-dependent homocysteine/selenocysteine methylase|nr:hypothetical protein [Herbinix sp.]